MPDYHHTNRFVVCSLILANRCHDKCFARVSGSNKHNSESLLSYLFVNLQLKYFSSSSCLNVRNLPQLPSAVEHIYTLLAYQLLIASVENLSSFVSVKYLS
jgi:hypothetical protein